MTAARRVGAPSPRPFSASPQRPPRRRRVSSGASPQTVITPLVSPERRPHTAGLSPPFLLLRSRAPRCHYCPRTSDAEVLQPTRSPLRSGGVELCKTPGPERPALCGTRQGQNQTVEKAHFQKASEQEAPAAPDGGSCARDASPPAERRKRVQTHSPAQGALTRWQAKQPPAGGTFRERGRRPGIPAGKRGPGSRSQARHQERFRHKTPAEVRRKCTEKQLESPVMRLSRNLGTVTALDRTSESARSAPRGEQSSSGERSP